MLAVPTLPPGSPYKYMGVLISVNLNWADQMAYVRKKVLAYQHMVHHQSLSTDHKIYVSNMVANAFVTYGMCVIPYPAQWIAEIQEIILATIKASMQVPRNTGDEPFFMLVSKGGRGLVHLADLQAAITCSSTL